MAENEDDESGADEGFGFDPKEAPEDREVRGPFDVREAKDVTPYVDFGGLLVRPRPQMQLKLEVEEASKRVVAITMELAGSALQVQAFAAARSEGLWAEIRRQLASQIERQGGRVRELAGELGTMVRASIPRGTGEARQTQEALFVGVDGPRWFLRGVISGRALADEDSLASIVSLFRSVVVNRGRNPMPPRDLIPLRVPAPPMSPHLKGGSAGLGDSGGTVLA